MSTTAAATITGIDAHYYDVQDFARALAFYRDTLGLTPTMVYEEMVAEFTFPGGETFGLYKSDDFQARGGIMFAVPNVHDAAAELRRRA